MRVLASIFLCLACAFFQQSAFAATACSQQSTDEERETAAASSERPAPHQTNAVKGTYYLGTSESGELKRAWFFYLNPTERSGKLYLPPKVLDIKMESTVRNEVAFTANSDRDQISFEGTQNYNSIEGTLNISQSAGSKASGRLRASRISPRGSTLFGRYSNVQLSDDTGDLTGTELILMSSNPSSGLIVFYESYWNEPTYVPLLLEKLERKAGAVYFELQLPESVGRYRLQISDRNATLDRLDVRSQPGLPPIVLIKKPSLLPVEGK